MTDSPPTTRHRAEPAHPRAKPRHAWERWAPAWHWLFYVVLALATWSALADGALSGSRRWSVGVLAVTLAGWYGFWALHRRIWDLRMPQVLVYLAGAATLWVLLEQLHEAYFLLAFAAYPQVFAFLPSPRSAIRGAVVLTGLLLV
ncbi:MAG: hypothetical protein M3471_02895, partial [Actinomycetota bacterium]|nr:hypothetical protein [Actinomycetota bacterium]